MTEGGFDNENPDLDWHLDLDDEDDDADEQEVNHTQPFQPALHPHLTMQANRLKYIRFLKNGGDSPKPLLMKTYL